MLFWRWPPSRHQILLVGDVSFSCGRRRYFRHPAFTPWASISLCGRDYERVRQILDAQIHLIISHPADPLSCTTVASLLGQILTLLRSHPADPLFHRFLVSLLERILSLLRSRSGDLFSTGLISPLSKTIASLKYRRTDSSSKIVSSLNNLNNGRTNPLSQIVIPPGSKWECLRLCLRVVLAWSRRSPVRKRKSFDSLILRRRERRPVQLCGQRAVKPTPPSRCSLSLCC
jgi:hypothetical protein